MLALGDSKILLSDPISSHESLRTEMLVVSVTFSWPLTPLTLCKFHKCAKLNTAKQEAANLNKYSGE